MMLLTTLFCSIALQAGAHTEIHEADFAMHVQTLSSDAFEGRGPVSKGEEVTVNYLAQQFEAAGLEAGNGDSWFQQVPLLQTTPTGAPEVSLSNDSELVFGRDLMLWSPVADGKIMLRGSELVFVGYGIVAPEFGWNDYADPGFATQDPKLFSGNAMTYYGRWTYKYEEARRQGAAAALVVHEEAAAGYPWTVVLRSWGGSRFGLDSGKSDDTTSIEGWITEEAAIRSFASAGKDFAALSERAKTAGAPPIILGVQANFALTNRSTRSMTRNVVARLKGAERPDEHVLFCAHWDHLGRKGGGEDDIYNGAVDNATGCAALLELAQSFGAGPRPARSILFLAFSAEESGLLGSRWYAQQPVYPLDKTAAGINMDVMNIHGRMQDVVVVGMGASELDDYLAEAAAVQGRTLAAEASPEKGSFYRSDHFNFAKKGVPMLYASGGTTSREHGADWVKQRQADYTRSRYHQPSDEFDPSWDLSGAIEDIRLYEAIGRRIARERHWPRWRAGNEFEAARQASSESRR
ncbi:MAG: Zn-dependent M28 family amino/carboxypeptidase [Planctomycetota bacterium]|jgi:Zn-dependent M28 family amino/carboxypeptidase